MATIRKEVLINVRAEDAWDALRDIGALHTRLVPGFVTDVQMESDARIVTFANGITVRERIVSVDDLTRRVVWSSTGGALTHHNGAAQVFEEASDCCRFVWIADVLPNDVAPGIEAMMTQGSV